MPDDVVPIAVAAHGSDPVGAGRACVAHLTIQLSTGVLAHVHVNWLSPTKIRTIVVGGSARTVVWDDLSPTQRLSVYDRGVDRADPGQLGADARAATIVSYRTGDMIAPAIQDKEALRAVMAELVDSITQGRRPLTDGWSGLQVLAMLEAASASLARGGVFMPIRAVSTKESRSVLMRDEVVA